MNCRPAFLLVVVVTLALSAPPSALPNQAVTGQEGAPADDKQHGQARQQPLLKDEPEIQKAVADKRQDERSTADKELRWTKIGAVLSGAATFLLVVFGGIGTALVYGQLRAMRESNRITQESNERTLAAMQESNQLTRDAMIATSRAHVAFDELPKFSLIEDVPLLVGFRIYNSGNTPARRVTILSGLWVDERPEPDDWDEDIEVVESKYQDVAASIFLPPGSFMADTNAEPIRLTRAQIGDIKNGRLYLFFTARIRYDDGFGNGRITQYYTVYDAGAGRFTYCDSGNWAD